MTLRTPLLAVPPRQGAWPVLWRTAAAVALSTVLPPALAQSAPPTAGSLLQSQQQRQTLPPEQSPGLSPLPAPAEPDAAPTPGADTVTLVLREVQISGNQAIGTDALQQLAAPYLGQRITWRDLQTLTQRMTQAYRSQGYLLARAWLAPQTVTGGQVQIRILEGTLEQIRLHNQSAVPDALIREVLAAQVPQGQALQGPALERALLLLNALPGLAPVQATVQPGDAVGATVLEISAAAAPRLSGRVSADNQGNHYTGTSRLGWDAALDNLTGHADRLALQGTLAGDGNTTGQLSWDALLSASGARAGVLLAGSQYRLGQDYAALGAHGFSSTLGLYGSYPLVRTRDGFVDLTAQARQRQLQDSMDAVGTVTRKRVPALELGAQGRQLADGAATAWNGQLTLGHLSIGSDAARAADAVAAHTDGSFAKLNASVQRDQPLSGHWSARGLIGGQLASRNLDASEQYSLGGPYGVRAYPVGEAAGDQGWQGRLELRYALSAPWLVGLGYDAGGVQVHRHAYGSGPDWLYRRGPALFTQGQISQADVALTLASRSSDPTLSAPDRHLRLWLSAGWRF